MKEIKKLKMLKKRYKLLLKLIEIYALPMYGYYNGEEWHDNIEKIIKQIDTCLIKKLNPEETLKNIAADNAILYRDYVGLNLIIKENDIIKRERLNKFYTNIEDSIFKILHEYSVFKN